jgi:hypothetical protein
LIHSKAVELDVGSQCLSVDPTPFVETMTHPGMVVYQFPALQPRSAVAGERIDRHQLEALAGQARWNWLAQVSELVEQTVLRDLFPIPECRVRRFDCQMAVCQQARVQLELGPTRLLEAVSVPRSHAIRQVER